MPRKSFIQHLKLLKKLRDVGKDHGQGSVTGTGGVGSLGGSVDCVGRTRVGIIVWVYR